MAENTPVSRKILGNSTEELAGLHGDERQLVVDTTKNTVVVMDGTTLGGHPLAKESVKIKSGSSNVKVNDSTESDLSGDITVSVSEQTWGRVLDTTLDFDDSEQVEAAAEGLPVGASVAYECCEDCDVPSEDVKIGGAFNTKEIITESGDYLVPVTGTYKVTLIGGGKGGLSWPTHTLLKGGDSGSILEAYIQLKKGQIVPVVIGAGGIGVTTDSTHFNGGATFFGNLTTQGVDDTFAGRQETYSHLTGSDSVGLVGAGRGGAGISGWVANPPTAYGAGGSAVKTGQNITVSDGYQGCVILEYYDAAKDKNISVDMASSITIKELAKEVEQLKKERIEGGVYNEELWIEESGDWEVPVDGYYEVMVIGGGQGGYVLPDGTTQRVVQGGSSGKIKKEIIFLTKGALIPVIIGAGTAGVVASGSNTTGPTAGGVTSFGDISSATGQSFKGVHLREKPTDNIVMEVPGGGLGAGFGVNVATFYGAGGGANYVSSSSNQATDGYQGAVHLRWHNPLKDVDNDTISLLQNQLAALSARVQELENG